MIDLIYRFNIVRKSKWTYPKKAVLQWNNPALTNSTPSAETNVERKKKKKTIKQNNRAQHEIVKGGRFNI